MWRLIQFGTITLPPYNEVQDISPAPSAGASIPTIAGGFDQFGTATAPQTWPLQLTAQAAVYNDTLGTARAEYDTLRALTGKRNLLWRTAKDNAALHHAQARVVALPTTRQIDHWDSQPLTMNFELWSPWHGTFAHGTGWVLDSGIYFDSGYFFDTIAETTTLAASPGTATVTNAGNMPVLDAIVRVTAGSAALSGLSIRCGDAHLTYAGTVGAGTVLTIDAGAWSVKNGTANAFSQFAFGTAHALAGMFELAPGANSFVVTFTGGSTNSTINVEFFDTYA